MAMLQSSTIEERTLAGHVGSGAGERLLERFAVTLGDLPASAQHYHTDPGGLFGHALEVALKALEEFEGNMKDGAAARRQCE